MNDLVSRQSAIDEIKMAMCEDGFRSETGVIHKTTVYEIIRHLPPAEPDTRLKKIAELTEGTIDHFDLDDAMDLLYQIKGVLGER